MIPPSSPLLLCLSLIPVWDRLVNTGWRACGAGCYGCHFVIYVIVYIYVRVCEYVCVYTFIYHFQEQPMYERKR